MTFPPEMAYQFWKSVASEATPLVSVVTFAFGGHPRGVPAVAAIADRLSGLGQPWEMIVIDDGSREEIARSLRDLGLVNGAALDTGESGGIGRAIRRAILAARGEYIVYLDDDDAIEEIGNLLAAIAEGGWDALGVRDATGDDRTGNSLPASPAGRRLRPVVRRALGMRGGGTRRGIAIFTRDAARRLFTTSAIDAFPFDPDILSFASGAGFRIGEARSGRSGGDESPRRDRPDRPR